MQAWLQEIGTHWGLTPDSLETLEGGAVNRHWLLRQNGDKLVLRRYNDRHLSEALPYEHELLSYLSQLNWPVAAPLTASNGQTVVETENGRWSLFPFLDGSPPPRDYKCLRRKGAVLALLHRDLAGWSHQQQRPGFSVINDLETYLAPHRFDTFEELIERLRKTHPDRADRLYESRMKNLEALQELGATDLPEQPIYFECLGNNVLFEEDEVTGLLDFDFAHRDLRLADVARSLVVDCGLDEGARQAWLAGYLPFAEPGLSAEEMRLLPTLLISAALWNICVPLAIWADGGPDWMADYALADIDALLPGLEAS